MQNGKIHPRNCTHRNRLGPARVQMKSDGTVDRELGAWSLRSRGLASHHLPVPWVWFSAAPSSVPWNPSTIWPSPSPPSLSHRCPPAPSLGTGMARSGDRMHTPQCLGWGMVAATPSLCWQHQGAFMGCSAGTSLWSPRSRYPVYPVHSEVAHLLTVGAGGLWKEMPGSTSCPRPGAQRVRPATGEKGNLTFRLQGNAGPELPGRAQAHEGLHSPRRIPIGPLPAWGNPLLLLPTFPSLACLFWPV
uniref:Vesicle transport through interaction with t-SNAREs homolog 1A isoform X1 n=1 Tax=Tursiops truncatus TaxID=9739 RepID=A0A2U4BR34_TURTR|nr:vesicle transport through interaction with t-SNAREs homolog 1A isoform X1 [Tursiops truncatus]